MPDSVPGIVMTTKTCGFVFTTTGRPCGNHVADGVPWCRAGHPCSSTDFPDDVVEGAPDRSGASSPRARNDSKPSCSLSRTRRATELVRQAMASEDADEVGLRAEHVLADGWTALALLGGADASPAARAAVVQRFGRVGALLVLGYEEQGRANHLGPVRGPATVAANSTAHGTANGHRAPERLDDGKRPIEHLVRDFAELGALELYRLLCEIDDAEGFTADADGIDAHRWLHATYAVAARDGTPGAHRAYMSALDRVMRLVRPLVAS